MVQKNQEITFKRKKFRKGTKQEMGQGFYFPGKLRKQIQTLGGEGQGMGKKARNMVWNNQEKDMSICSVVFNYVVLI